MAGTQPKLTRSLEVRCISSCNKALKSLYFSERLSLARLELASRDTCVDNRG
jgi:hypothetical protein